MKRLAIVCLLFFTSISIVPEQVEQEIAALDTASVSERPALLNNLCWKLRYIDSPQSFEYGKMAIEESMATGNTYELIRAYNFAGVAARNVSYFEEAFSYYSKGLELAIAEDEKQQQCYGYINIANLNIYLGKSEESLRFLEEAAPIIEEVNVPSVTAYFHLNRGHAQLKLGMLSEAMANINRTLEIRRKMGDFYGQSICYKYLGDIYKAMNEPEKAEAKFRQAMGIVEAESDKDLYTSILNSLAKAQLDLNQNQKALKSANQSLALAMESKSALRAREATQTLADIAHKQGDFALSEKYLKEVIAYNEELYTDDLKKQEDQFRYTLKTQQLEYEKEKQAMAFAAEKKRILILSLSGGILLLVLGLGLAVHFHNKRKVALQKAHLASVEQQNQLLEQRVTARTQELENKHTELKKLASYKEELTHMIAHDLKNPLNVILGLSDNATHIPGAQNIREAGKSMLEMVSNMLDVQRFEEAQMNLKTGSFALFAIVERAYQQVETLMKARSIVFHNLVADHFSVEVDQEIIRRVFTNLFANAIKFTEPGGAIAVNLEKIEDDPKRIRVVVSDTGCGVDESVLPRIFDKYFQAEARKSGHMRSSGLGLTFCRMAVESHKGEINVTSQVGLGTTFRFDLALSEEIASGSTLSVSYNAEKDQLVKNQFNAVELAIVEDYSQRLKDIPLYEASRIIKVLNELTDPTPAVSEWKEAILKAAYNWDDKKYKALTHNISA